ncbi:MAG: prolyl oligopeptidase family serine peptidase [Chitinophagaceae bacterium]|nr:prolyl oligopeptidase family serine peptidase [Chitinophagaceae bacterium]
MNNKSGLPKTFLITLFAIGLFTFNSCDKIPAGGGGTGGSGGGVPSNLPQRVILDTAYGNDAKQKMDIYLPAGRNSTTKVIIMIHGGAWQAGDKSEVTFFKTMFWQRWPEAAVVNINYRLASNTNNIHHAEIMADIKNAVNFITNNKTTFAISDTLALWGNSAGAHLALLYTYAENTNNHVKAVADLYGPAKINDWSWYNSFNIFLGQSIKNVLTTYNGSTWENDSTYYYLNSPWERVNANSKPTIIFHGTIDVIVPLYQSQWLHGKLNSLNVPNEYYEYFLDGHGFNQTNNTDCVNKTVAFFQKHLK